MDHPEYMALGCPCGMTLGRNPPDIREELSDIKEELCGNHQRLEAKKSPGTMYSVVLALNDLRTALYHYHNN